MCLENSISSVSILLWGSLLHKILTIDKLQRWQNILTNGCIVCLCNADDAHYLFIHCSFVFKVWHVVYQFFGIDWLCQAQRRTYLTNKSSVLGLTKERLCQNWCLGLHCGMNAKKGKAGHSSSWVSRCVLKLILMEASLRSLTLWGNWRCYPGSWWHYYSYLGPVIDKTLMKRTFSHCSWDLGIESDGWFQGNNWGWFFFGHSMGILYEVSTVFCLLCEGYLLPFVHVEFLFSHVFRESNMLADVLVKDDASCTTLVFDV